jgi:hypothetical protein
MALYCTRHSQILPVLVFIDGSSLRGDEDVGGRHHPKLRLADDPLNSCIYDSEAGVG